MCVLRAYAQRMRSLARMPSLVPTPGPRTIDEDHDLARHVLDKGAQGTHEVAEVPPIRVRVARGEPRAEIRPRFEGGLR